MSRKKPKVPRHLRDAARRALAEGWELSRSGSGHIKWTPPRGPAVFTGSTPKRYGHAPENTRQRLARAGLETRRG